MENKFITFDFTALYLKYANNNADLKNIWVIFHGYGQLSEDFFKSFDLLTTGDNLLLFPQGLSKFYLKGVGKQVGASWMTSHERETDISNYISYLNQIYEREVKPIRKDIKLNLLGFSQGGHTVSRWINKCGISYNKLVIWGSSLAYEISKEDIKAKFSSGTNVIVIGDKDRFFDEEKVILKKRHYSKIEFDYQLIEYEGGHEILPDVLKKII
jgi:predicted esterase